MSIAASLWRSATLLNGLTSALLPDPNRYWPGQTGGANANTRPGSAATADATTPRTRMPLQY